MGLIGRIGEMLRLQAETTAFGIFNAPFTGQGIGHHVAGVELYTGLGSRHFQPPSAARLGNGDGVA